VGESSTREVGPPSDAETQRQQSSDTEKTLETGGGLGAY
jgi:hypothetical protein